MSWTCPSTLSLSIHPLDLHQPTWADLPRKTAAVSSYIALEGSYAYSIGGHTGEAHLIGEDGGFGTKVQELPYLPADDLVDADKTRKALVSQMWIGWKVDSDLLFLVLESWRAWHRIYEAGQGVRATSVRLLFLSSFAFSNDH